MVTKTERENWEGDKNQRKRKEEGMEKREKRMERLGGVLVDEEKRKES